MPFECPQATPAPSRPAVERREYKPEPQPRRLTGTHIHTKAMEKVTRSFNTHESNGLSVAPGYGTALLGAAARATTASGTVALAGGLTSDVPRADTLQPGPLSFSGQGTGRRSRLNHAKPECQPDSECSFLFPGQALARGGLPVAVCHWHWQSLALSASGSPASPGPQRVDLRVIGFQRRSSASAARACGYSTSSTRATGSTQSLAVTR